MSSCATKAVDADDLQLACDLGREGLTRGQVRKEQTDAAAAPGAAWVGDV